MEDEVKKLKLYLKLAEGAKMPKRISGRDFKIFSNQDIVIGRGERTIIKTGLQSGFEANFEMQVLNINPDFIILNEPGTVDADYRGEIGVIVYNDSEKELKITKGVEVAAIRMAPYINPTQFDERSHGSELAAGYDIFSTKEVRIEPGESEMIETNAEFVCNEEGYEGMYVADIRSRSGNAVKLGLSIRNRGVLVDKRISIMGINATNYSDKTIELPAGSKVAQCVFSKNDNPCLDVEIEEVQELSETIRGERGMGNALINADPNV